MAEPLRHRQTKEAETDTPGLPPPRHIPTLPCTAFKLLITEPREMTSAVGLYFTVITVPPGPSPLRTIPGAVHDSAGMSIPCEPLNEIGPGPSYTVPPPLDAACAIAASIGTASSLPPRDG